MVHVCACPRRLSSVIHRCTTETISNCSRKTVITRKAAHENAIHAGRIELPDHRVESRGDSGKVALGAEIAIVARAP